MFALDSQEPEEASLLPEKIPSCQGDAQDAAVLPGGTAASQQPLLSLTLDTQTQPSFDFADEVSVQLLESPQLKGMGEYSLLSP